MMNNPSDEQALDALTTLFAWGAALAVAPEPVPAPEPTPKPELGQPVRHRPELVDQTIYVSGDEETLMVPVKLSAPLKFSASFRVVAENGEDTWPPRHYEKIDTHITMHRGEQVRLVPLVLHRMRSGMSIIVKVGWNEDVPHVQNARIMIVCDPDKARASVPASPYIPPVMREPGKLVYETDFIDDLDRFKSANRWGRYINHEAGPYVSADDDPSLYPVVDGVRTLMLKHTPDDPVQYDHASYAYRQPMLTTRGNGITEPIYGVFELDFQGDIAQGILSAWWSLAEAGGWPPERDFFELWSDGRYAVTDHYKTEHGKSQFGAKPWLDTTGIDLSQKVTQRVECDAQEQRTFVNGNLIDVRPNIHHVPMYHIFSIAAGGEAAGRIADDTEFPATMRLYRFRVWEW